MRYFALFTGFIFFFYLVGLRKKSDLEIAFMGRNFTTIIRGFAILTVVWAHLGASLGVGGIQFIAGIGVALFLICSGYGLEMSWQKNGLAGFWKKRVLSVCLPFWTVEWIALLVTGNFVLETCVKKFFFINAPWFMQYIMICYLLFFFVKWKKKYVKMSGSQEILFLFTLFVLWFMVDSLFFAAKSMPFLRARQMLSFPTGVLVGKYLLPICTWLDNYKEKIFPFLVIGGGAFMAVTQLSIIQSSPYIISNLLSLLTVFPLALAVLTFGTMATGIFRNQFLRSAGLISYEIYLTHYYALTLAWHSVAGILLFMIATTVLSVLLYLVIEKGIKKWLI